MTGCALIHHEASPWPNNSAIQRTTIQRYTSAGRTAIYYLVTVQFSSLWTVRHIHLRARNILLLHKNLIVHPDTLIDNAMVEGGSPLCANLMGNCRRTKYRQQYLCHCIEGRPPQLVCKHAGLQKAHLLYEELSVTQQLSTDPHCNNKYRTVCCLVCRA